MARKVPSFYAVVRESVQRVPVSKLPYLHQNDAIAALQDANGKQTGALCKTDLPLDKLVTKIRNAQHSLLVDVQCCKPELPNNCAAKWCSLKTCTVSIGTGVCGESLGFCGIESIGKTVAQLEPVRPGDMLIVGATSAVRKGARYIRIGDGQTYHICTDPSYLLVGLVPGERANVVENAKIRIEDVLPAEENIQSSLSQLGELCNNVRYYLIALTDPISYDMHNSDWSTLLIVYSAVLRVRELGRRVFTLKVSFISVNGHTLLELHFRDGALATVNADHTRGILRTFEALLSAEPAGAPRANRLALVDALYAAKWRTVLIALVVAQVAEQAHVSGEVDLDPLRYSRVVDECIGFVSKEDVQAAVHYALLRVWGLCSLRRQTRVCGDGVVRSRQRKQLGLGQQPAELRAAHAQPAAAQRVQTQRRLHTVHRLERSRRLLQLQEVAHAGAYRRATHIVRAALHDARRVRRRDQLRAAPVA